jgi:protoporphyrinogen oxidase
LESNITILGSGLAGLAANFHLKDEVCEIFEKNTYAGGHIHSEQVNGFVFDEGPHVSFTKHKYVKNLFAENIANGFLEYPVESINFYKGFWIPHPAQSNLFAIPEPLRTACLDSFLNSRLNTNNKTIAHYAAWLNEAFGEVFTNNFSKLYTKKYWTVDPENLTTKWVGDRIFYPNIDDVKEGYLKPPSIQTHYISHIRYPKNDGYFSYAKNWAESAFIHFEHELSSISFKDKEIRFSNGKTFPYKKLISTIPLPILIEKSDASTIVKDAAKHLSCSSVFIINVMANHKTKRKENWIYVYDEDKYSTRINCTELLAPNNAPANQTGIQVEVYFSNYKPLGESVESIKKKVVQELLEMGLLESENLIIDIYTKWVEWANVIFDHKREENLDLVLNYLSNCGLVREFDDLEPTTNWNEKFKHKIDLSNASLVLAGRFAQWKYYWTDDCVLRGKFINDCFNA